MNASDSIIQWLISEARTLGQGDAIVDGYCERLVEAGVPLTRANIAARFSNPLLVAWGVIWTPDSSTEYDVTHAMLDTDAYVGSPFHTVLTTGKPLHKSLRDLDLENEHAFYRESVAEGAKDLYANFLEFGDGTRNGSTYITHDPEGFQAEHVELIESTRFGLASALEPVTMRKSTESLLRTYIGRGPANAVTAGTIMRGEHAKLDAVVMFSDLRGFTAKSEQWNETTLLKALNEYFETVVQAVETRGGDVLKFMGDGILSIFPIDANNTQQAQCAKAVEAARTANDALETLNKTRVELREEPLAMGIGINVGSVTYGNIGSPERLDFTVLGSAVNIASRIQDLCKIVDEPLLVSRDVITGQDDVFASKGFHDVRGLGEPIEVFSPK